MDVSVFVSNKIKISQGRDRLYIAEISGIKWVGCRPREGLINFI